MFELLIVGLVMMVALGTVVWSAADERKKWQAERAELLNRLMSRDFRDYTENQVRMTGEPMKVIPLGDLKKELFDREEERIGMPV